ncbi:tRNA-histidine guanylyltransferase 1-like [Quaeritorhiza haematococci]|nr:tRNA-histidine guanylyltransferase 1-like [Quaeritorhiza haematococci]
MACSRYEYVKSYERNDSLLPNTWLVVRIDGHNFHRFSSEHNFAKPNDPRALQLASFCAEQVMTELKDICIAYGQSDEYSFVFRRKCNLYKRREAKITSVLVSLFTSNYVFYWRRFFGDVELKYPPSFDSRAVLYPTDENLRDYLSWRQADCHINNLMKLYAKSSPPSTTKQYNTAFWALVQSPTDPKTEREAESILKDTDSAAKNELLFSTFNINYNKLPAMYRKGTVLYRKPQDVKEKSKRDGSEVVRRRNVITVDHCDIIGKEFWEENAYLLKD